MTKLKLFSKILSFYITVIADPNDLVWENYSLCCDIYFPCIIQFF